MFSKDLLTKGGMGNNFDKTVMQKRSMPRPYIGGKHCCRSEACLALSPDTSDGRFCGLAKETGKRPAAPERAAGR